MIRTKLEYNCYKMDEYCVIAQDYKNVYDRSFDMWVSATTKEECKATIESFEDIIRAEKIQDYFDSNSEIKYNENKKLWIGSVEVYINNDWVSEEKETIKEVYTNWKKELRKR